MSTPTLVQRVGVTGPAGTEQVTTPTITAGPNRLFLLVHSSRTGVASSVTGGGLTWTLVRPNICFGTTTSYGFEIYRAYGSPASDFTVTVTHAAGQIAVSVDSFDGTDGQVYNDTYANIHGTNGPCTSGTLTAASSIDIVAPSANALLVASWVARSNVVINSSTSGWDAGVFYRSATGTGGIGTQTHYRAFGPGSSTCAHQHNVADNWAMGGLALVGMSSGTEELNRSDGVSVSLSENRSIFIPENTLQESRVDTLNVGLNEVQNLTISELPPTAGYPVAGCYVETPINVGPIADSNGNIYYINEESETTPDYTMRKSADGGQTWSIMDNANRPPTNDLEAMDIVHRPSEHTLYMMLNSGGSGGAKFSSFRTSDHPTNPDTWGIRDEVVRSSTPLALSQQSTALTRRSNGEFIAFFNYNGGTTFDKLFYRIRATNGTWGAEQILENQDSIHWHAVVVETDSNNITHIMYYGNNGTVWYRTLSATNVLSGRTSIESNIGAAARNRAPFIDPVKWQSGSDEKIMFIYNVATGTASTWSMRSRTIVNGILSGASKLVNAEKQSAQDPGSGFGSRKVTAHAAVYGTKVMVIFAGRDGTSTSLTDSLWYTESIDDGDWSADTILMDRADFPMTGLLEREGNVLPDQVFMLSGNVFTHQYGTVFGYVADQSPGGLTDGAFYSQIPLEAGGVEINITITDDIVLEDNNAIEGIAAPELILPYRIVNLTNMEPNDVARLNATDGMTIGPVDLFDDTEIMVEFVLPEGKQFSNSMQKFTAQLASLKGSPFNVRIELWQNNTFCNTYAQIEINGMQTIELDWHRDDLVVPLGDSVQCRIAAQEQIFIAGGEE